MKKYLLTAAPLFALTTAAHADDSLTMYGITLYGTVDVGVAYQTHGAPLSDYFTPGLEYSAWGSKNLRNGQVSLAPNGLSQSKIGLKGTEELVDGWNGLFKLETGFSPVSGQLSDSPKSLVVNNGKPASQQLSAGDSSRAGQPFQGAAYAGVSNATYGTLTFGRQNTLLLDNINKYDPMGGAYAFSILGYNGAFGGGGDTQDARFDNSMVYVYRYGPVRVSGLYKFGGGSDATGRAYQFGVGADFERLSIDANYAHTKDAISVASLNAAQALAAPGTLSGTISDNDAYSVMASYTLGAPKLFLGYENLNYANPSNPLAIGAQALGYNLSVVNNAAYTTNKKLNVVWTGMKYSFTPSFDLTGAYYWIGQNNYTGDSNSCLHNTAAGACGGQYNMVSLMADYHLTQRFDVYGGAAWSQTVGGLASGALDGHSNTIDPMIGVRYSF